MSDALKPLDLESIEAARADYTKPGQAPEEQAHRAHGLAIYSVPALVAEVKRLREALKNIRDIEEYLFGRACTCSGVGCVQCIARLTLEGREGELFS